MLKLLGRKTWTLVAGCLFVLATGCGEEAPVVEQGSAPPVLKSDIARRLDKLPETTIDFDRSLLDENETAVVKKLIEAADHMDQIFLVQVDERNPGWLSGLEQDVAKGIPGSVDALALFRLNYGPWDRLDEKHPFIANVGPRPEGGGFYPGDMTEEEFNGWLEKNPGDGEAFRGLFTVIRRTDDGGLEAIPYSEYYKDHLEPAATLLREAAEMTSDASLRSFLNKRADAFLSDDYYASDIAWMDLNGKLEVVIGPYEVYEDGLFNYKAAFEAFICVVDKAESESLGVYVSHLPAMEMNLPIPDEHKNMSRGAESPIKVVQEIYTAGDTRSGVQTAAFNLPNDERVREEKGSKKVMLKNVIEAKFNNTGEPIAKRVLETAEQGNLSFDAFFNQILFHELSHGLGPGIIKGPDGKRVEARFLLQDTYSMIEECKADVTGVWNLMYMIDEGVVDGFTKEQLFASYAGISFRSMRFGLDEAHGGGMAIQWNWYREKGAIVPSEEAGRFHIDFEAFPEAVRSLANELLMIEATGDYERAQVLIANYAKTNPEIDGVIAALADIPVDLRPVYPIAGE